MDLTPFSPLSDDARLWIYAADRLLAAGEQADVRHALRDFCAGWTSHGRPVRGAADVVADRFLVVAAEIPGGDLSGCGIDASTRLVETTGQRLGVGWLPSLHVFYRDATGVHGVPRSTFRALARDGVVTGATPFFDLGLGSLGELRRGRFERPAGETWHAQVFRLALPAS